MSQRMIVSNIGETSSVYDFVKNQIEKNPNAQDLLPTFHLEKGLFYANEDASNPTNLKVLLESFHLPLEGCKEITNQELLTCIRNVDSHPELVKDQLYNLHLLKEEMTPVNLISEKGYTIDGDMFVKLISYTYDDEGHKATIDFQRMEGLNRTMPPLPYGETYKAYSDDSHDRIFVEVFEII